MLDRSDIMRDAHRQTRNAIANGSQQAYHVLFAAKLRFCWYAHKFSAAATAREAAFAPLPATVAARIADLRLIASTHNFTSYGAAQFRALNAEADDIARAARCSMIPAHQDLNHAAH